MIRAKPFYVVLYYAAGGSRVPFAILLLDPSNDLLIVRARNDLDFADDEDLEVLQAMSEDIRRMSIELGPTALLDYFEDVLSNTIQISERRYIEDQDVELHAALEDICRRELS